MAMLIVAIAGGLRLLDVPTLAAVVSLTTLVNVAIALWGHLDQVNRRLAAWVIAGQIPALFVGLGLLTWLHADLNWWLQICLGVFITLGGLSMYLRAHPWAEPSPSPQAFAVGFAGGLMGGMFAASGPVLGWFGYNQPLPLAVIRATLLACFGCSTFVRTVLVGVQGGLTEAVLTYALFALPVVVIGTWSGRRFKPLLKEQTMRRCAYVLLLIMGIWILVSTLTGIGM
eukprot:g16195.t1